MIRKYFLKFGTDMISKEQFVKVIESIQSANDFLDRMDNEFHIDLYGIRLIDYFNIIEDTLFKLNFNVEAIDTINWWLYEYDKVEPAMWDSNDNVIPMETLDDLWNYVKDYRI